MIVQSNPAWLPDSSDPGYRGRTLQIVCADPALARRYLCELERGGALCEFALAISAADALRNSGLAAPAVTLLDESAVGRGDSLHRPAGMLCEIAPVVAVASREREGELAALAAAGWLNFVPREGEFVSVAAGLLERRIRRVQAGPETVPAVVGGEQAGDFGELLRHEVNNPLTGILGNAELLLARRDRLPPGAIERLETIAELAVRLRETVRRLSHTWQERYDHVHSA